MNRAANEVSANAPTPLDLNSVRHLETILGRSRSELKDLAKYAVRYYKPFPLRVKERPFARIIALPKKRLIDNPVDPLKAVQSRIEERLLKRLILPEHLLGGVRGKSIIDNANLHRRARCLVTIDIKNFFPSVRPSQVLSVWRNTLNCSTDVSYLLTGLTTCRGRLPQGSPTSTLIANLVLASFDPEIQPVCQLYGVSYSSWIDDLAFSGDSAPQIVGPVIGILMKAGFKVSHGKIKIMGPGTRKVLNKLVLGRSVTVQKEYVSRIRAGIHNLNFGKVAAADTNDYLSSLEGTINYLRLFDPKKADVFLAQLETALTTTQGAAITQAASTAAFREP
jgi:RNA-directed DNA polymerase